MIGKGKKCKEPTIHYWKHWEGPIQAAQQQTQGLLYCISGTPNASNQEKAANDTVVAKGRSKRQSLWKRTESMAQVLRSSKHLSRILLFEVSCA